MVLGTGLIPASAGSTSAQAVTTIYESAHPRVCGEHCGSQAMYNVTSGSSPRLRGARSTIEEYQTGLRLIPASAGSTLADKHFQ